MGTSQGVIDLRARRGDPPTVAEQRDNWFRLTRDRLGLTRQQWFHPATTELLEALADGTDTELALRRLGEARALAGVGLEETLADLAVLDELLPPPDAQHRAVHLDSLVTAAAVGAAWAEAHAALTVRSGCLDELTGLVTQPFLEARLAQVYRHCSYLDLRPADAHALVVARLGRHDPSPFARVAQRLRLAGDLRLCFPGSDTLAVLDATERSQTMVALTSRSPELPTAVEELRCARPGRDVWVESLPEGVDAAVAAIRALPDRTA